MESEKFTFDNDFSSDIAGGTYSNKMQKLSDDAFNEGKEQGFAEAQQSLEKNCEMILDDVKGALNIMISRHEEQIGEMEKNATSLVLAIVQKLAPAMVADKPIKEIENLVQECLRNNPTEPRMVIRVDEQMLPLLRKKIDIIQTASDYHGQIVLISEPMTNISDCRVEWIDGGAERDFEGVMKSIEETVQIFVEAPVVSENTITDNNQNDIDPGEFPINSNS